MTVRPLPVRGVPFATQVLSTDARNDSQGGRRKTAVLRRQSVTAAALILTHSVASAGATDINARWENPIRCVRLCHGYATGVGWLAQNASASCLKPLPAPLRQCSMRGSEATETGCHAMRIRLGA